MDDHEHDPYGDGPGSHWANYEKGWSEDHADHLAEDDHFRQAHDYEHRDVPLFHSQQRALERMVGHAQIAVSIRTPALHQVLQEGRLKSQFETNSSGGALAPDSRARLEEKYFGYPKSLPAHSRPIYGYLTHDPLHEQRHARRYGSNRIVLKRPNLWHRTSVVFGDSLDLEGQMSAHPVDRVHASAYPAQTSYGALTPPPSKYDLQHGDEDVEYAEAHVHGGVRREDIHYVVTDGHDPELSMHLDHHRIPWVATSRWSGPTHWNTQTAALHSWRASSVGEEATVHAAQPPGAWLISLGRADPRGLALGQIADIETGELHRPQPIDSILARGYWQPPPAGVRAADILALVKPATR